MVIEMKNVRTIRLKKRVIDYYESLFDKIEDDIASHLKKISEIRRLVNSEEISFMNPEMTKYGFVGQLIEKINQGILDRPPPTKQSSSGDDRQIVMTKLIVGRYKKLFDKLVKSLEVSGGQLTKINRLLGEEQEKIREAQETESTLFKELKQEFENGISEAFLPNYTWNQNKAA